MTALFALAAAASEAGLVRQDNEDAAYAGRWLFAVADGLGGHTAGHGDHADRFAVLRWPRHAGSHRRFPRVPAPQRAGFAGH